jgi:hypothetical protein
MLNAIHACLGIKRAMPHETCHLTYNIVDSEQALVPSLGSSLSRRTVHYLKKRGKDVGVRVLAKLNINLKADSGEVCLCQSATSSTNANVRACTYRERYVPLCHLGSGGNGEVHLCRHMRIGILVAVQTIYHEDPISPPNEASILRHLGHHGNIIWYHTTPRSPTQLKIYACSSSSNTVLWEIP